MAEKCVWEKCTAATLKKQNKNQHHNVRTVLSFASSFKVHSVCKSKQSECDTNNNTQCAWRADDNETLKLTILFIAQKRTFKWPFWAVHCGKKPAPPSQVVIHFVPGHANSCFHRLVFHTSSIWTYCPWKVQGAKVPLHVFGTKHTQAITKWSSAVYKIQDADHD